MRGVGAGGIVSSAVGLNFFFYVYNPIRIDHLLRERQQKFLGRKSFVIIFLLLIFLQYCLLYKLYTLKLTRKQVNGLITHTDSPFIRGLGFMYIRYTQPPADLFDWYEEFLQDEEEVDPKAGGGQLMTMGQLCRQMLTKLDWFSTLFPRIPVPIQKQIEQKLSTYDREHGIQAPPVQQLQQNRFQQQPDQRRDYKNYERERPASKDDYRRRSRSRSPNEKRKHDSDNSYGRHSRRSHSREKHSSSSGKSKHRDRSRERKDRKKHEYDDTRSSKRY